MDLLFWQYSEDENGLGEWNQVAFDKLDKNSQKAVEAFAKTEAGYELLSPFANEGDKIGSVEFKTKGVNSDHNFGFFEYDYDGAAYGQADIRLGKENASFDLRLNIGRQTKDNNAESMAVTIGHESFIHLNRYIKKIINAYNNGDYAELKKLMNQFGKEGQTHGKGDHDGYIEKKVEYQKMYDFLTQLKSVLNPQEVNNQIKKHDAKYKK